MKENENVQANGAQAPGQNAPKKKSRVLNILVNTLLVIAIALGIFCSFTAFIAKSGNTVPSFFGFRPFAIQSDSMAPFFNKGDLVISKTCDTDALQVGDVITFWTVIQGERALNTHRIIAIEDGGTFRSFTTKGDNNSIEDGLTVHQSEVVGKYVTHIPGLGSVIDFLQTSKGFLLVIVLPCAIFFIYQLIVFFKALFAYQAEKTRLQYQAQYQAQAPVQAAPVQPAAPAPAAPEAPAPAPVPEAAPALEATPVPEAPAAPAEEKTDAQG